MLYTLLANFLPSGSYHGEPGCDPHGKFILFPITLHGIIATGDFLKTQENSILQIKELLPVEIDGNISAMKCYY